jgi:hypothetical protein
VFEEGTDDAAAQLSVGRRRSRYNAARTYTQSIAAFEDSLGGGIQVDNNRTCAHDGDAVSNTVDGPGDVTRALSEVLEVALGAKRLLQVRDQGTRQLHALSRVERDRALWRRDKKACWHRTVGEPHE